MAEDNQIKKNSGTPAVETFTDDMVKVIEDSQGGLIKKIIQDQEKHEIEKKNFSPESKRNRTFVLVSLILILLAVAVLAFLFFTKSNQLAPVNNTLVQPVTIIYTDKVKLEPLDGLTNEQIADNFLRETNLADIRIGEVEAIYGTENDKTIGLRRFMTLLKSSFVPGDPNLVSDNFLMGAVNRGTKDFFMIMKVRSFVDVFTPMRNWENKIFSDLHILFGEDVNPATSYLLTKNFEDGIIENKNARILYDMDGNIAVAYVFADDHDMVITNSRKAVREVMLRLAGSQIKQ